MVFGKFAAVFRMYTPNGVPAMKRLGASGTQFVIGEWGDDAAAAVNISCCLSAPLVDAFRSKHEMTPFGIS